VQEAAKAPPPSRPVSPPHPPDEAPLHRRLKVPLDVPGANAPPLKIPPADPERKTERDKIIATLYPNLPPLPADPVPTAGPRLDLTTLQQQTMDMHPALRQAAAPVEPAR